MAKRIVIADDSATIQRAFAMTFGAEDVTLVAARSAEEGLGLAKQAQTHLVIADGMMPGRSGYDLCAAIKSDPSLKGTAVYILSSAQQPFDEARGRQCGADGHFSKPFDTTAIIEKVHEAPARGAAFDTRTVTPPAPFGVPLSPPAPSAPRTTIPEAAAVMAPLATEDDDYGEISVDMSPPYAEESEGEIEYAAVASTRASPAAGPVSTPQARPSFSAPPPAHTPAPAPLPSPPASLFPPPGPAAPAPVASMRPSLIPGIRPGSVAPTRPGSIPMRPIGTGAPAPSRPPAPASRTLMGLPAAANVPVPGTIRQVATPPLARAVPTPHPTGGTPAPYLAPPAVGGAPPSRGADVNLSSVVASTVSSSVGSVVDQKMAAFAARGPEYEAVARMSREIIEQIVWEIVPELAEAIIREHLEKQGRN